MRRREVYILAIPKAQEIIMDFLKDNFRQDQISLVENVLKLVLYIYLMSKK